MKECCETGAPKKRRYWHWVVLGAVMLIAVALQQLTRPYYCPGTPKAPRDISLIMESLDGFAIDNKGQYPATLLPLVTPDENGHCYLEGYNGRIPTDPWKREYVYAAPTPNHGRPRVFCFGADGKTGGSGDDADVDSDWRWKEDP